MFLHGSHVLNYLYLFWKHCQEDPIYKEVSYQGAEPSSPQFSTNQSTQQKVCCFSHGY